MKRGDGVGGGGGIKNIQEIKTGSRNIARNAMIKQRETKRGRGLIVFVRCHFHTYCKLSSV
jgi:hypothetical protein